MISENSIRELSMAELDAVAGGPLIVIPAVVVGKKVLAAAFGVGVTAGVAGATIALTNDGGDSTASE